MDITYEMLIYLDYVISMIYPDERISRSLLKSVGCLHGLCCKTDLFHAWLQDTPGILDGNSLRDFWISWTRGRIMVGRGYLVGQDHFMQHQASNPRPVYGISVSTGYGSGGVW